MATFGASSRWLSTKWRRGLCLFLCFGLMSACKTSDDATAAASQMATTAQDLASYYSALATVMDNTIKLEELQSALLGTTFGAQDLAQLQQTKEEIQKRSNLAKSLQSLSAGLTKLTGSTAAADVSTAANSLGTALSTIKEIPNGPSLPAALGEAGQVITRLVEEHDERKAAALMDGTISAVAKMFTAEKPVCQSLYTTYFVLADSLAEELLKRNWVDEAGLLTPALQPFGLSPATVVPAASTAAQDRSTVLSKYAQQQLATQAAAQEAAQRKASEGMDQALQEMSKRIHTLATEKAMPSRGSPVTLADVEAWASKL